MLEACVNQKLRLHNIELLEIALMVVLSGHQRTEPFVAKPAPESSAVTEQLMEEVCNRENLVRAWKRVRQNKGGPGVDGMTIDDAADNPGRTDPGAELVPLQAGGISSQSRSSLSPAEAP